MKKGPAYKAALVGVLVAMAMILSYVESLIPAFIAVPGMKIGFANIVTVFAMYFLGRWHAFSISIVRVLLSALLFGSAVSLIYSISGALLSFMGMALLRGVRLFSPIGVSTVGGVFHNLGQIIAACLVLGKTALLYLPALIVCGVISGVIIGVIAGVVLIRVEKVEADGKNSRKM